MRKIKTGLTLARLEVGMPRYRAVPPATLKRVMAARIPTLRSLLLEFVPSETYEKSQVV